MYQNNNDNNNKPLLNGIMFINVNKKLTTSDLKLNLVSIIIFSNGFIRFHISQQCNQNRQMNEDYIFSLGFYQLLPNRY